MKHQDGFFDGVRGSRHYHQSWLPDGDSRAALLVVHGLAEHSGRYMNLVNHFVPRICCLWYGPSWTWKIRRNSCLRPKL
jgi:hypothetical protein